MKKKVLLFTCVFAATTMLFACNIFNSKNEKEITTSQVENDDNVTYDLAENMDMPNIVVDTNKGVKFDLEKTSKPALINFWATWCPPCRTEMPGLQSLYEEFSNEIDFIMVNVGETKETVQDFLVENETYTFPIGYDLDGSYATRFGIVGIPTTFIVGKDKVIKNYVIGAREESQFREYLENIVKNK